MQNLINRNIFVFGQRGCGKDTFGEYLVRNYGYEKFSFGDKIRRIAKEFGIDNPQREHLVSITNMGYQLLGKNVWVNLAIRDLNEINKPIIITDMRYPEIYEYFLYQRKYFPVHIINKESSNRQRVIERDGYYPESLSKDQSEQNFHNFSGFKIYNDHTIPCFERKIDELLINLNDHTFYQSKMNMFFDEYKSKMEA